MNFYHDKAFSLYGILSRSLVERKRKKESLFYLLSFYSFEHQLILVSQDWANRSSCLMLVSLNILHVDNHILLSVHLHAPK